MPDEAAALFRAAIPAGDALVAEWERAVRAPTRAAYPAEAAELRRRVAGELAGGLGRRRSRSTRPATDVATRKASQEAIRPWRAAVPELFGGAADLSESNLTDVKGGGDFSADRGRPEPPLRRSRARDGRRSRTGSPTTAASSRTSRRSSTFSDYMRGVRPAGGAVRAATSIYVWTHDSVGPRRGRPDAPAGRALRRAAGDPEPVVRPARRRERDGRGLGAGGRAARRPGGAGADPPEAADAAGHGRAARDGRRAGRLRPPRGRRRPRHRRSSILIATGSELQLAVAAADALEAEGIPTRVVSLPCWELFEAQDAAYREAVLPPAVRRAGRRRGGVSFGWERWVGDEGAIIGLDHFGASAPAGTHPREVRLHAPSAWPRSRGGSSATGCAAASCPATPWTRPGEHGR